MELEKEGDLYTDFDILAPKMIKVNLNKKYSVKFEMRILMPKNQKNGMTGARSQIQMM